MGAVGTFPFGMPVEEVVQTDRTPKRVFVLGAYAGAVHARWLDESGETLVNALAVASEPEVFWRGDRAAEIVSAVPVPPGAGTLVPAADNLNGTSGLALDLQFLMPLGLSRADAWLCDLVPYSCSTDKQVKVLRRAYDSRAGQLGLPAYDWPPLPDELADAARRAEIAAEIAQASPEILIALGDQPLRWFTRFFGSKGQLAAYGESRGEYGRFHELRIGSRTMAFLPLAHPRQVAKAGSYNAKWAALHEHWEKRVAPELLIDTSEE